MPQPRTSSSFHVRAHDAMRKRTDYPPAVEKRGQPARDEWEEKCVAESVGWALLAISQHLQHVAQNTRDLVELADAAEGERPPVGAVTRT
ncbi:MAG: hypothetical protein ACRDJY_03200 [Thermoleophilaceae bacterium]